MLWKWKNLKFIKKLINMCATCVHKTRSAVRIEGTLSSFFENKTGLKKGDALSLILFNLALQMKWFGIDIRSPQSTTSKCVSDSWNGPFSFPFIYFLFIHLQVQLKTVGIIIMCSHKMSVTLQLSNDTIQL